MQAYGIYLICALTGLYTSGYLSSFRNAEAGFFSGPWFNYLAVKLDGNFVGPLLSIINSNCNFFLGGVVEE